MTKRIANIISLLMFSILIWSCRKTIEIKPKSNDPVYVIEGRITDEPGVCKVLISKTKNLGDGNQFEGLSGAMVKIENNGITTVLPETTKGTYEVSAITGKPGQTYKLTVSIDGKVFTASSTMPELVLLQDAYIKSGDFDPKSTVVTVKYKDIPNVKNYYWFRKYVNGKEQRSYDIFNDDFTPGTEVNERISFINENDNTDTEDIKHGDQLKVTLSCVDTPVYTYLSSLVNAGGSSNAAAPGNPISNISGGATGFFSAHTVQSKTVTVP